MGTEEERGLEESEEAGGFTLIAWRASPDDWISIAHLNVWAYREHALELGPEEWPEVVRKLTEVGPAAKEGSFWVVRKGVEAVASMLYRGPGKSPPPLRREWASVDLMAVAPPLRGGGLGSILVDTGLALAAEEGAPALAAVVYDYQEDAQNLFDRHGFHRERGLARRGQRPYSVYRREIAAR